MTRSKVLKTRSRQVFCRCSSSLILKNIFKILKKSAEENVPSGMRIICFRKVNGKFGARHFGNLISFVDKNGPAGLAGLLKGDQIISINGINVETLSKDNINAVSKNVSDDVTLVVRFNPERLADLISDKWKTTIPLTVVTQFPKESTIYVSNRIHHISHVVRSSIFLCLFHYSVVFSRMIKCAD